MDQWQSGHAAGRRRTGRALTYLEVYPDAECANRDGQETARQTGRSRRRRAGAASWKYHHIGNFMLNDILPPNHGQL
jgi:transposase